MINNIVNKKKQRDELCQQIDKIVKSYYLEIKRCAKTIDNNKKLKLIAGYNIILFNYADEISYLIKGDRFTTIHSLTRDFLECYAIIIETIKLHNKGTKYNEFQKYLIIKGLYQEISIIKELKKINDNIQKNIQYVEKKLEKYFLKEEVDGKFLNGDDIKKAGVEELSTLIEDLYNKYTKYNKYNKCNKYKKGTNKFIADSLKQNLLLEKFKNKDALYRDLCNYTHINQPSVEERVIIESEGKSLMTNFNPSDNIPFLLTLIYCCLRDVYEKINRLINE